MSAEPQIKSKNMEVNQRNLVVSDYVVNKSHWRSDYLGIIGISSKNERKLPKPNTSLAAYIVRSTLRQGKLSDILR